MNISYLLSFETACSNCRSTVEFEMEVLEPGISYSTVEVAIFNAGQTRCPHCGYGYLAPTVENTPIRYHARQTWSKKEKKHHG